MLELKALSQSPPKINSTLLDIPLLLVLSVRRLDSFPISLKNTPPIQLRGCRNHILLAVSPNSKKARKGIRLSHFEASIPHPQGPLQ